MWPCYGAVGGNPALSEDGGLRDWLRVPAGLRLPGWVLARLRASVARELEARAGTALGRARFAVVDLETTGLSPVHARILEIGAVALSGARVLGSYSTLVDIGAPVPWGITALTGIDTSQLAGAPREVEALAGLASFLAAHRVEALVAHNARFDRSFLARAWAAHQVEPPLPPFLCSVRLARRFVRAQRYGLDALVAQLSIPARARHRALGDAEMTSDLWRELLARARLDGVHTLEALRPLCEVRTGRAPRSRVRVVELWA